MRVLVGTVFSALPFVWIMALLSLVVRTRLLLGYWPRPAHPDPKLLPFEFHHIALWMGFYFLGAALAMGVTVYVANRVFFKAKLDNRPLWIFLSGCSLITMLVFGPHTDFNWVAWFLD